MDNLNLYHELEALLRMDNKYCMDDGTLIKNKIVEDALTMQPVLLKHLLSNEVMKKNFFSEIYNMLVFDKIKFQQFIMNKSFLPDSYTTYKNKIGLVAEDGRFISENRDIVLAWPYKDCVLEGGQTKEDVKRDEIFWSETLAPEEISRLIEPKAFVGFKRFDKDGEASIGNLSSKDNLIIKGNNLLTLHSLKEKYRGKVKLIYLDPPYYFVANKSEDTFSYNSNFKLSTWCTFMKNRLEIARELLSEDGALFIQISDDGVGELHLLLKEVFNKNGENNFINKITVKTKSPSGFASVNPGVFETAEYILAFAKNKSMWRFNQQFVKSEYDSNYAQYIVNPEEPYSDWRFERIDARIARDLGYKDKRAALKKENETVFNQLVADFALKNKEIVFRLTAINDDAAAEAVALREKSRLDPEKVFCMKREDNYDLYVTRAQEIAFYAKKIRVIDGEEGPTMQLTNIWYDISYEGIAKEGDVKLKGGKKPEKLMRRIIEMASNPGDLVLDFFAGSGTTAAVAHKLGRQFITCDQLDSQIEMSLKRLKAVLNGEQSGISKLVNWKGGGSFVFCQLATANWGFADEIQKADSSSSLKEIWERMKETGYLNYKINPEEIDENTASFEELSLDDQKRFLIECLDKNMLYIPISDMDSEEYEISEEDKRLTREFYKKL